MSTYPHRPKAEAFDNAVDVVELLLVLTDQALNVRHLRVLHTFSAMTSLAFLIQQGVEEVDEFRQHNGVVTMMMFYRCRASPKHRYDITEVEYGGGGHRTRLGEINRSTCVSMGCPPPPYIKEWRRVPAGLMRRAPRGESYSY